ncbi:MAG: sugar ABC transporter ATP-binding protein, partial [Sphingobacteriales bacterium]
MLRLLDIHKSFMGVKALAGVSLNILPGQVHAICGENGAGKSTLMHIISGSLQPDQGEIHLHEKPIHLATVEESGKHGIAIVYQDRTLAPALSVAENIFPGSPPLNRFGLIDASAMNALARELLDQLSLQAIDPSMLVEQLSPARQQMVEIARALATRPVLLILDEPTASLTGPETNALFKVITKLRDAGTAIIYISHRMQEIALIADKVSVLRDGHYQGSFDVGTIDTGFLVQKMVGRILNATKYTSDVQPKIIFRVANFSGRGFSEISFDLHAGEIIGIAGLEGAGRTELVRTLIGDLQPSGGTIELKGRTVRFSHPADAVANGIAYLPENRKKTGLFPDQDIRSNIVVGETGPVWYDAERTVATANTLKSLVKISCRSVFQPVTELSGGNQQKVLLARWINLDPDI